VQPVLAPGMRRLRIRRHAHLVRQERRRQPEVALEGAAHVRRVGKAADQRHVGQRALPGELLHRAAHLGPQRIALDRHAHMFGEQVREPVGRQAGHRRELAQCDLPRVRANGLQHAVDARVDGRGHLGVFGDGLDQLRAEPLQPVVGQRAALRGREVVAQLAEAPRIDGLDAVAAHALGEHAVGNGGGVEVEREQPAAVDVEPARDVRRNQRGGAAHARAVDRLQREGVAADRGQQRGRSGKLSESKLTIKQILDQFLTHDVP
jgi:hypothetical protein